MWKQLNIRTGSDLLGLGWHPLRRHALLLCVGSQIALGAAVAFPHELTMEETRSVTVGAEKAIYVKNSRGQTIILGRKGADVVRVRASKYVRSKSEQQSEEWMAELTFTVETDGDKISIISNQPDRLEGEGGLWALIRRIKHRARIDYTIEVPNAFDVEVSSASGDVQVLSLGGDATIFGSSGDVFVRDLGGDAFIEVSSGDVELTDVVGNVAVRASSGDAVIRNTEGSVTLQATSGDLEVYEVAGNTAIELASGDFVLKGCGGDVDAMTASGDVVLSDIEGSVRAVAASGDIRVTIVPVGAKEFIINTSSGDVRIMFATPDRYGFRLEVTTSSGTIEGDLDIKLDTISRRMLRGTVGTGASHVLVETASGNIRIVQADK